MYCSCVQDVLMFIHYFSIAVCQFSSKGDQEWYVVVGTAKEMILSPRYCSGGSLIVFKLSPDGSKLDHIHTVSMIILHHVLITEYLIIIRHP